MEKEKLFSKLNSKDYNFQLEKILENKEFPENIKNLLLSMLYKIEAAYRDYTKVKGIVEDKKIYIEEILDIIKNKCRKIIVVKENSEQNEEMTKRGTNFIVDILEETIYLKYPNERLLLYTLYKLDNRQIYLEEKYNLVRVSLSELLNAGEDINNVEVIRDFNGWNWNVEVKEIPEVSTNAIYQNLIYLLGIEFIKDWIHTEKVVDYVELATKKLTSDYGEEQAKEILKLIYKIAIIICTSKNEIEKKRLLEEKEILQSEFNRLDNKAKLLEEISEQKKQSMKKIKQIDTIINDKDKLAQEYIDRNEKRAEYNKIFNLSHLVEILNKERKKILNSIEENNKLLEPENYIKVKGEIEEQLQFLADINLEETTKQELKKEYMINLQKKFIQCFIMQIKKAQEKDEIIKFIYMVRYYNYLHLTENLAIKDVKQIENELNEMIKILIQKAHELKAINLICNDENMNFEIMKNVLLTKIIVMENIIIEPKRNENNLELNFYDTNVYEKNIVIQNFNEKELNIKLNKKVKIFN